VAASDRVVAEHLQPDMGQGRYLSLDDLAHRLEERRVAYFTLLAHQVAWLRPVAQTAVQLSINSGTIDTVHGDIPELANRIRTWIGVGHEVVALSDQPHRVAELLVEQELPVRTHEGGVRRGLDGISGIDRIEGMDGADRDGLEDDQHTSHHPVDPANPADPVKESSGAERKVVHVAEGRLSAGFRLPGVKLIILTDAEIFGERRARPRPRPTKQTFKEGRPIMSLLELKEGDLVVHVSHGIGRYRGLVRMDVGGIEREFLRIDYHEPDKLYVPSDQLDRVQKYIGSDESAPSLHRLGGGEWFRTKSRVKAKIREMAKELVQLYAARKAVPGYSYGEDTVWQEEMEAAFEYQETDDQLRAIHDVKGDMELDRPMDRLICGDVGFGKTEVALRAAFKAVSDGKQVAVLVPTTVLAQQHHNTFSERFAAFPIKVEMLSRFRSRAEQKKTVEGLQQGTVDVVIGTHRLLSKDVQFRDLGLLVVDEEQRFGVGHKEKIKQLKTSVDVLTLTATPIPRTLHMSLAGIRDMSVIEDPPEGRLAVRTFCMEAEDKVIRDAILRELDRGGQVYYVHNRIDTIYGQADRLQKLVPQARIRIGHGQMKEDDLEEVMLDFYDHEYDILCSTTIIESGLDVPNVNTIIINDADHLGLAQLHQLRGRVGRSSRQAYCYLLYKPFKELTEVAEKRLQAVREFTELGAGFQIAMRDMEIRGAGNLLGGEQHGQIVAVGFDLYIQMIEEAVKELQGQVVEEVLLPGVSLPIPAFIPEGYIPTEGLRIAMYKKIAACREMEQVKRVQEELEDRFGDPPPSVWNLLSLMRLRIQCLAAGVARVEHDKNGVTLWMARRVDNDEVKLLFRQFRRAKFLPDRVILYVDDGNVLRPVEELVEALRAKGGEKAREAVQRQLQAAELAGVGAATAAR
jgi:transcription-repair coupling factor (superfamily II helicase)